MINKFKALQVNENKNGVFERKIITKNISDLPQNEILIKVKFAALNYKDALSASGHKGITKKFPHTPGVDASGIIVEDKTGEFKSGTKVIVTGYDLGMNTDGGFGNYISVPTEWIVPLPKSYTLKEAMIVGTAGFTAGLSLYKMELNGQKPDYGPILVTGATGGVGSLAVAILTKAGYEVIASTGNPSAESYLKNLGAKKIISREAANIESERPLLKSFFAGAIDTVGGNTLTTLLKSCKAKGNVATTGLVLSPNFSINVYPFIIKGINLLGIDSAETQMELRLKVWEKLANEWRVENLSEISTFIQLVEIINYMDAILQGKTQGRIVVEY